MNDASISDFVTSGTNLASPRIGSRVIHVSDAFFAPANRMLEDTAAFFIPGKYNDHGKWEKIMSPRKLEADTVHRFDGDDLKPFGPVSHVKLNSHPDGGVSRFRVFGRLAT